MKQSIVLIEIENGMIQVYADKNILVATHDYDTEGNDLGRIDRENNEAAFVKLTEKLDAHSATGANEALEVFESRTTTDWIKEFAKIQDLRDKAIQYIASVTPADGLFVSEYYVQVGENFIEVRHIGIDKDGHITLNDKEIEPIVSDNVPDSDWVLLAGVVQEAIAGGTGK